MTSEDSQARIKRPTRDDYDEMDEYYGPWRQLICPNCGYGDAEWDYWSLPDLRGLREAVMECPECEQQTRFIVED